MSASLSQNLYYTEGSSDKVYQLQLEPQGDGFVVNFQYGRRGSTLKSDTKTPNPVSYAVAEAAYNKLLKEKTKKGYTPDQSGSIYQNAAEINVRLGDRFTGVLPQLLNPVRDPQDIEALLKNDKMIAQEKHDGERRSIVFDREKVLGVNRDGLSVALPVSVEEKVLKASSSFTIDGEIMGERYVAFDIVEYAGKCVREKNVSDRLALLEKAIEGTDIEMVKTAFTEKEKRDLARRIGDRRGEGVVFKDKNSKYVAGRPASGGNQLKWKFVESATVRVKENHATKRSIFMECLDGDKVVDLGKCSVPKNYDLPTPGDLVEVEYLYMYKGGSLYQPQYKGQRLDKKVPDSLENFKVKADVTHDPDDEDMVEEVSTKNAVSSRVPKKKSP